MELRWPFLLVQWARFRGVCKFEKIGMEGSKTHIVHIHTVLEGFAYPCETGYADFVRFYETVHLKIKIHLPYFYLVMLITVIMMVYTYQVMSVRGIHV